MQNPDLADQQLPHCQGQAPTVRSRFCTCRQSDLRHTLSCSLPQPLPIPHTRPLPPWPPFLALVVSFLPGLVVIIDKPYMLNYCRKKRIVLDPRRRYIKQRNILLAKTVHKNHIQILTYIRISPMN